jgi:Beta-ketoacyl synthase, N-terminal domain
MLRNVHTIISSNSSFDKALLNVAEGVRTNGIGVSSAKIISCTLLNAIQANDEVYSAAFSLSVNNAIAGLYSIVYTNQREITVIAPAFIVVPGILLEGAGAASPVLYDEPIADFYPAFQFNLNVDKTCALTLKIALTGDSLPLQFSRSTMTRDDGKYPIRDAQL